jgi:HEAT repeat protein
VAALVATLQDGAAPARKQALQELSGRGPEARPALAAVLQALKDTDTDGRTLAQGTLARMGPASPDDVPVYGAALRDPAPELRICAAGRLGELGLAAKKELVFLRVLSLDENEPVREAAQKAVQHIEEELLESLTKELKDPSAAVRGKAARQLGEMGANSRGALPSLVEALADNNSAVRVAVVDSFLAIGPDAIVVLGEALRDQNPRVRQAAINALGRMGPDARFVLPELIAASAGKDAAAKKEALEALTRIGEYAIPYLIQALEREKDPGRQKLLVQALERLDPSAAPALQAALKAARPEVGKAAAGVLAKVEAQPPPPKRKDHAGMTGVIQGQLRGWFTAADTNKDDFLDKDELARAIRGSQAKAYDFTPPGKAPRQFGPRDFNQFPDYAFLCRLDRDNDGKVSRDEFELWAYDYAVFLKKDMDDRDRIAHAQARLMERAQSESMRLQREAAVAQLWSDYHSAQRAQNAMYHNIYQAQWMQRWTLNNLRRR